MKGDFVIAGRRLGFGSPAFIVAELGINHNGSIQTAKALIDAAADAGCDAVKFQKRTVPLVYATSELESARAVDRVVLTNAIERGVLSGEAERRLLRSNFAHSTNGDLKWALEFTDREYEEIASHARLKRMPWFVSYWDGQSVEFMRRFDLPASKLPSARLTDQYLLKVVRAAGKPALLSTGMSAFEDVERAWGSFPEGAMVLQCTGAYPTELKDLNLRVITSYLRRFGDAVGYSGHEVDPMASVAAVGLGARYIERHLTLSRRSWGSDHPSSLEPEEFAALVRSIRRLEAAFSGTQPTEGQLADFLQWQDSFALALGDGHKRVFESELLASKKLRRQTPNSLGWTG